MRVKVLLTALAAILSFSHAHAPLHSSWPHGNLSHLGRWIVNSDGSKVTYAVVNWPGAAETIILEGLQYQSVASIVSKIVCRKQSGAETTTAEMLGLEIRIEMGRLDDHGDAQRASRTHRQCDIDATSYNFHDWYLNMVSAAYTIRESNPDVLIFFSGLNFDVDFSPIPPASDLGGGLHFVASSFPFKDEIVLEPHNYDNDYANCFSIITDLVDGGFTASDARNSTIANVLPLVVTERGYSQDNTTYLETYSTCLNEYLPDRSAGWMLWVLAGSYYIREGAQDPDEVWGLLTHDWSEWRSIERVEKGILPMVKATLDVRGLRSDERAA